jgi:ABC-type Mn2+/Zn2+ transport system permease subunit
MSGLIELVTEPFAYAFMRNALAAGLLSVLASSLVGTWVVMRGLAFIGDALAHGVLPGIALAYLVGGDLLLGAALGAAVMVGGISLVTSRSRVSEDTAIGLLFVGMLALGVVILSRLDTYSGSLTNILFGDALGVTMTDVIAQALLAAAIIAAASVLYRPLLALSFNPDKAELLGMRPKTTHAALLVLIAAAVIGSYQSVGTLLVFGLLVGPPATAALLARTVPRMMVIAAAIALVSVWLGLSISYWLGTAGSATMALVPIVLFFIVLITKRILGATRTRQEAVIEHA